MRASNCLQCPVRAATSKARRINVHRSAAQARRASYSHAGGCLTQVAIETFPPAVAGIGLPLHELPTMRLRLHLGAHLRDQLLQEGDVLRFVAAPTLQIALVHRLAEVALFALMLFDVRL